MKGSLRTTLSLLLVLALCMSMMPSAFAAHSTGYHDPAENWKESNNRNNEFDSNAVVSHETFQCFNCEKPTIFTVFRVPEYTRDGQSNLTRGVKYSDGTTIDGEGMGYINDGIPGVDAYYTSHHWTKAVCETCGVINSNGSIEDYGYNKNVYLVYDCATNFFEELTETVSYEYVDNRYHMVTTKGGSHCAFCFGTHYEEDAGLERHDIETDILPQMGNQRFAVLEHCTLCDYQKYEFIAAKAVVADYYGVADGQPHTVTISDLSESGVSTAIRYGNDADSCSMTSAPNFIEEGQYTVYYEITYTYDGVDMAENGVAYVWLRNESAEEDSCSCGCGDENCDCQDKDCSGSCCGSGCGDSHNFTLLESVEAGCFTLGCDRYLCTGCGRIENKNYVNALGHTWQSITIRDATCENDGKQMKLCARCGKAEVTATPRGEHEYEIYSVSATCIRPGYTVKECAVCGDRHITDLADVLPHNYEAQVTPAGCETGGHTLHLCEGCGSSFVTDYVEPLGHSWDEGTIVSDATCSGDGVTEYRCVRCGYHRLEGGEAGGHVPGNWIVDLEATNETKGSKHRECRKCGVILEIQSIPKLPTQKVRHSAYIHGYPDGTVQPEGNMTRAEAATMFARLLAEKRDDSIPKGANTKFKDISADDWYSGYIKYISSKGIATGYTNKTYRPDEAITRAEFTAMAVRFFDAYGGGNEDIIEKYARYSDVSDGDWAAEYIEDATRRGWVTGYGDGNFRGNTKITRAEVVMLVNRLLGREADEDYADRYMHRLNAFSDLNEDCWAYYDIIEATNSHTAELKNGESWVK